MLHAPKVMRASSFLSFSRSAGSGDSVRRLASAKNRSFSASLEARPASVRSTRTRFALVFSVLARDLTLGATRVGSETLWRTDLSTLAITRHSTPVCTRMHRIGSQHLGRYSRSILRGYKGLTTIQTASEVSPTLK